MKYIFMLTLLAACSKPRTWTPFRAPYPAFIVVHYYGSEHYAAATNWAASTGEFITVFADPEAVLFGLNIDKAVTDSAAFRASKVLPLMKDCYQKTGIDHMEVMVMGRDVPKMTDYKFIVSDFE